MTPQEILFVRRSAEDTFASGLYCAESVLLALADAQGIESDLLPKISSAFCGGMARTRGTCGALTGALMGIGLALGRSEPNQTLSPAYEAAQRLIKEFEAEFGSRECHELLGCDLGTPEGQSLFREKGMSKHCANFTGTAAELAARIISDRPVGS
jgi:C_GCAxxG_C_C family probable redox protein